MTPQQIYDTVKAHLLQQRCVSINPTIGCAYRGDNGTKCAVGALIPDSMYDPAMEGAVIATLIHKFQVPSYFKQNLDLLHSLQRLHDTKCVETWRTNLKQVAKQYGLNP